MEQESLDGIGFNLLDFEGAVVHDLDTCRNPDTGEISPMAMSIVRLVGSYWEITPSGTGIRGISWGKKTGTRVEASKGGPIEGAQYDGSKGRYVTLTGHTLPESTADITDAHPGSIEVAYALMFPAQAKEKPTTPSPGHNDLTDEALLEKARNAANGDKFSRLWAGDTSSYDDDDSAADQALCSQLVFWTSGEPDRVDRLFRQSGLMRDKWDRSWGEGTYGSVTIAKAMDFTTERFSTNGKHTNGRTSQEGTQQEAPDGDVLQTITESTIRGAATPFPDLAWHPLLERLRNWIEPCTEAPYEWIFSAAIAAVEVVIGRRVYAQVGRRLYANSAQVNIGAADEKKGTPWALVSNELLLPYGRLIGLDEENFCIVLGTGSAEGLLERFMVEGTETDSKGKETTKLKPVPGRRVLHVEEELGYFLTKSHNKSTTNLRENICELWDGVDVSPPTRQRSLRVVQPFYSMLTMTTPETLSARLEEDDILSGMFTRFLFYQGTLRTPIAWPDAPNTQEVRSIVDELSQLSAHVQVVSRNGGLIEPSPATKSVWEEIYLNLKENSRKAATPALGTMLRRIDSHIIKTSLVFAMLSGHSQIEEDDLGRALALGGYWAKTATQVVGVELGEGPRKVEYKLLSVLEQNLGMWVRVRELHHKLSGRVKAPDFHAALKALIKLGRLEPFPEGEVEHPKWVRVSRE
jgi:hypothetical protein